MKKKSAYEVSTSKPPPAAEIIRPDDVVSDHEQLKSVNVAQARQLFNSQNHHRNPPSSAHQPKPEITPPPRQVESVQSIPQPNIVKNKPSVSAPEPATTNSRQVENSGQEMDWDDEFDLLGGQRNANSNHVRKHQPEDYIPSDPDDVDNDIIPSYDLKPMGAPRQPDGSVTREPWSDSDESLEVDGDTVGELNGSTYNKNIDPETQSIISQQSITLTDSHDLKDLALRHFVNDHPVVDLGSSAESIGSESESEEESEIDFKPKIQHQPKSAPKQMKPVAQSKSPSQPKSTPKPEPKSEPEPSKPIAPTRSSKSKSPRFVLQSPM